MKIACVGNMNNMMFTLTQYLRDNGSHVELFLFSDEPFLPQDDTFGEGFTDFVTTLPVSVSNFSDKKHKSRMFDLFSRFDFLIGIDIAPAFMASLGLKLDIFVPHGSDAYEFPFVDAKNLLKSDAWWLKEKYLMGKLQKIGIENAKHIIFPDEYDIHFPFKHKLKIKGEYVNMTIPMVYYPQNNKVFGYDKVSDSIKKKFTILREENEVLIFSHSRQNGIDFEKKFEIHHKGNDVLIEGFSAFVKDNSNIKAKLILFEYGMDVEFSKKLIANLKIDRFVEWMPKMKRKDVLYGLSKSDIGCGQFKNSFLTCGVVNEVLALNIPLLHYRKDSLYKKEYKNLYPIMNVNTAEGIKDSIEGFVNSKKQRVKLNSFNWIDEYTVKRPINFILNKIESSPKERRNVLSFENRMRIYCKKKHVKVLIVLNKLRIKITF